MNGWHHNNNIAMLWPFVIRIQACPTDGWVEHSCWYLFVYRLDLVGVFREGFDLISCCSAVYVRSRGRPIIYLLVEEASKLCIIRWINRSSTTKEYSRVSILNEKNIIRKTTIIKFLSLLFNYNNNNPYITQNILQLAGPKPEITFT